MATFNFDADQKLRKLIAAARKAKDFNPRTRGAMSTPPTITSDGSSIPTGQTVSYLRSTYPTGFFQETGGQFFASNSRYRSAIVGTTGGNLGDGAGGNINWWRVSFTADAAKVTVRVTGSTARYRFLIDGQYADLVGTMTTNSSGNEYITLDFTSIGGRKRREIAIEGQPGCGFVGVYVGANETLGKASNPEFRSVMIGDSWCYGSTASALGDGVFAQMADRLGLTAHLNSGSGGTGWDQTTTTAYNFLQRIQNNDEALNGTPTGTIFLMGSINDKNGTATNITNRCATAIQLLRSRYPDLPIIGFGVAPAAGGNNGTLSIADNEAAVKAAFDQFTSDNMIKFVPVSQSIGGTFIPLNATTGHPLMADTSHLNDLGCSSGGQWYADRALDALESMVS